MSFVAAIRDYVEVLNNLSDSLTGVVPVTEFLSETLRYILKTSQSGLIYIISFQWIRDFTLLPILIPQISSSLYREIFFLESPANVFFSFLEIPSLRENTFFLGICNSIFLTLPFSILHILAIRRLFIKGIPAATFTIGGYIFGQWIFLACVIFGLRSILIPWLTIEPLNYVIGVIIIFRLVYTMTQENLREFNGWKQPQYWNFFATSCVLAWCEQTAIFQYLGNINLAPTSSALDVLSTSSSSFSHLSCRNRLRFHFFYTSLGFTPHSS